ncbi:MAG: sugar ABC transporter permease [Erysipelotrichaceae bacterium]|nr:sugar ABC transporter permease [Erysipelotrichaceae bacterium]
MNQTERVNIPLRQKSKRSHMKQLRIRQSLFAWSLIIIPLLYFIVTWIFINGQTLLLAFKDDHYRWSLTNFAEVWTRFTDPYEADMTPVVLNTLEYWAVQEFLGLPVSFLISYFIYKKIKGYKVFRVIFYLPQILPAMVMVIAFSQFVYPNGVLDVICKAMNISLPREGLLQNANTAKYTLMVYTFFTASCGNILFYSAMARIPPELIEAAKIDGVTPFKEFIHIVLPLIMPTFMMTLLMDVAGILSFGPPVFYFGNPPGANTISNWFFYTVYSTGSSGIGQFGYMSALGVTFTVLMLPIVFLVKHLAEKFSTVEY